MKIARLLLIISTIILTIDAAAQSSTLTPYSRYGYGMLNDNATSAQRAMGGVGYAMNSGRQINVMNPASYGAIDSLTFLFDMGGNLNIINYSEADLKEKKYTGGLDYITMSFPIAKRIGASVGLLPYATTGYSFNDSIINGTSSHEGSGGISMIYAGAGVNPFADLYVGFNMAYMFGQTTNDLIVTSNTSSSSLFQRYISIKDWHLDLGIQYPVRFGNNRITLGATYSPGKGLHGETYGLYYDITSSTSIDTIGYTKLNGKYSIPATYGAGINYTWRERLMVEADFTYQPWKNAKYATIEDFESNEMDNRWKVAAGVQYTRSARGSYWQRMKYRAGAFYNHDYLMVHGNNVRDYGFTAGLGFPVVAFKSYLNVGFEYRLRQAHPTPLIKEKYFNFTIGINFNEMWFRKSKIY